METEEAVKESLTLHRQITGETSHHKAFDLFAANNSDILSRSKLAGHVTGSALVVDTKTNEALVIYAAKFDKWILNSAGGHVDDGEYSWQAAQRELFEEMDISAAPSFVRDDLVIPLLFDVHPIPASDKKQEPAHWHYDMVFLFEVDGKPDITHDLSEVSRYVWKPLDTLKPPIWGWDVENTIGTIKGTF